MPRLGDPEAQVLLPLLETDLIEVLLACVEGRLDQITVQWKQDAAVTVVMAAQGYPDEYPTGHDITGIERATDAGCIVYLAGRPAQGEAAADGRRTRARRDGTRTDHRAGGPTRLSRRR